jgi:sugar phosphate isomerase/epimerase
MLLSVQLYTLRNLMDAEPDATLTSLRDFGLKYVEMAGQFRMGEPFRAKLAELGLAASGSHVMLNDLEDDFEAIADPHRALDCHDLIVPWIQPDYWTNNLAEFSARMNKAGEKAKAAGFQLSFHNHDHEMKHGKMHEFLSQTDPELVKVQFDLGWVVHAGEDALSYLEKYAGRITSVLLKDMSDNPAALDILPGFGRVPFGDLIPACDEAGVKYGVIEMDNAPNSPLEDVQICVQTYRGLGVA